MKRSSVSKAITESPSTEEMNSMIVCSQAKVVRLQNNHVCRLKVLNGVK